MDSRAFKAETLKKAKASAIKDMEDNVFKPVLHPLSDNDLMFLDAMAQCAEPVTTSELQKKLNWKPTGIQPYRKRLIDAGVIESPRRGELVFTIPYFKEYLLKRRNTSQK